jgi:hypothetical protein
MAVTDADVLRRMLGERIPENGTALDTMFSDEEITDFLNRGETLNMAAYLGWQAKAAELANLVDTAEGSSKRSMSDLHKQALAQVKYYEGLTGVTLSATHRARVGNVTRPE